MKQKWEYCTLAEFAEGDSIRARVEFHTTPPKAPAEVRDFSHAAAALYELGREGWELVSVNRVVLEQSAHNQPRFGISTDYFFKRPLVVPR